ncbi:MAG: hypothetical protein P8Y63_09075 [Deltaproteobacteria bacterium]|jgi:hypothetical protein
MRVLLITFDLQEAGQEDDILEQLKDRFDVWSQISECTFAVETGMSPHEVYEIFKPLLLADDIFYVLNVTRPFHGQGPLNVNEWLDDILP